LHRERTRGCSPNLEAKNKIKSKLHRAERKSSAEYDLFLPNGAVPSSSILQATTYNLRLPYYPHSSVG